MADNKGTILGIGLLGAGLITFFGLDGAGKIKKAFADDSQSAQVTKSAVEDIANTEKIEIPEKTDDDKGTNNVILIQSPQDTKSIAKSNEKNDGKILTQTTKRLSSDRNELPKSTQAVQVRKPQFVSNEEKSDPTKFNKRKFGIDEEQLQKAQDKSSSKRTIDEKKLIEAEKARQVFDSRSISNF